MSTNQLRSMAAAAGGAAANTAVAQRQGGDNFPAMLDRFKGEIARALPKHLNADQMARVALTCFRLNPLLSKCQPASVFACVIQASQMGLRPGLLGEAHLIPYYNNRKQAYECQLIPGYQGLLELVRRSGLVESIGAYLVHANDVYEVRFGTDPGIRHEPCLEGDPGAVRFGYAVARMKGGASHIEVMTLAQIIAIRDRSQGYQRAKRDGKPSPWDTDFEEMARKTLLRRIAKFLPKSPELATALALDNAADAGRQDIDLAEAITGDLTLPEVIDAETGEVATPAQVESVKRGPDAAQAANQPAAAHDDGPMGEEPPPIGDPAPAAAEPAQQQRPAFDLSAALQRLQKCTDIATLDVIADEARTSATTDEERKTIGASYYQRQEQLRTLNRRTK